MNRLQSALKSLSALYTRRPVVCNACMYTAMYATADLAQQAILKQPQYDWPNVGRMAIVGGTFFGPAYYYWYHYLDKIFPGTKAITIVKKLCLDQGLAGIASIVVFFPYMNILEGKEDIVSELVEKGPKTYVVSVLFWPAVQAINFFLLPTHARTTYIGIMNLLWTSFVAYIKSLRSGEDVF